ncbi:MAG TPA: tetratricopeptide repeat protein [Bacteroidetes bacterium]|nr:tetratricopeptide repeat protein [Bacteroidota bacterium]
MKNAKLKNMLRVFFVFQKNILLQPQNETGMSKKKEKEIKGDQRLENIGETLTRTETFIINNQMAIFIVVAVIVIAVFGYFGYQKYIIEPKTAEAQEQIFEAQQFFKADSLNKALYGDGNNLGFIDIADNYSSTKPGNLANYYAGICFLKKGQFDQAINYLKDFDGSDAMVGPMAKGAIGDAYLELGKQEKAVAYYLEAANQNENKLTTPLFLMKAGEVYELMGNYNDALDVYNRIKEKYPQTNEGRIVDKNIGRATGMKERK